MLWKHYVLRSQGLLNSFRVQATSLGWILICGLNLVSLTVRFGEPCQQYWDQQFIAACLNTSRTLTLLLLKNQFFWLHGKSGRQLKHRGLHMLLTQCSCIFFSYKSFYEIDMLCKVMLTKLELTYFCRGRWGSPGRLLSRRICGGQSMYFSSMPESISTTE